MQMMKENIPIIVYANKADLSTCLDPDEITKRLNLDDIKGRDWSIYASSALKGTGVVDGIKWIFDKLKIN